MRGGALTGLAAWSPGRTHDRIIAPTLREDREGEPVMPPLMLRLLDKVPLLQQLPARFIGLGIRREHVRSPDASAGG
ncbi:MAG: hypothetical protein H6745_26170 [Deltaproteobacteria bacterium]|nr:hypothetical protein [Deltaproteobacteria bacterium]